MQYRKLGRTQWEVSELGYGMWGIRRNDEQRDELPPGLLGIIWLEETDDRPPGTTDIGYALTPKAWGKGIAFEAARSVVDYAFDRIGASAVDALIFGTINPGSVKLVEKLGGRYLGKKPFEEYGGQEWFETCHNFDLWLIETANMEMLDGRVRGACFRTGQFVAEGYLTRSEAVNEVSEAIARGRSLQPSDEVMAVIDAALNDGIDDCGWSHYRIEKMR